MLNKNTQTFDFSNKVMTIHYHANANRNTCIVRKLINAGMPVHATYSVDDKDYREQVSNWVLNNWPTNTSVMLQMYALYDKLMETENVSIGVYLRSHLKDAKGVGDALQKSMIALQQLKGMFISEEDQKNTVDEPGFHSLEHNDGLTLAGTKPPDFSNNTLHTLSYAERQELVAKSMARLEEVPRSQE